MKTKSTSNIVPFELASSAGCNLKKAKSLATKYDVCSKTIFRWADSGRIHRYKINQRLVLFNEAEVDAFIEQSRVSP